MAGTSSDKAAPAALKLTRLFDAPRALVFEAWTSADHVARWFAPRPLTIPRCTVEFRVGGIFRCVMRMPDGFEHPMEGTFREIVVPERIVFASEIQGEHGPIQIVTHVSFAEEGGKTRIDVRQTYSAESRETRGAHPGWTATLDQLGEHAAALARRDERVPSP